MQSIPVSSRDREQQSGHTGVTSGSSGYHVPVVIDDFRKIFREFREVKSCFTRPGLQTGFYKMIPETHGFFGVFEKGRVYNDWIWKDKFSIGGEQAVAFFRQRPLKASGLPAADTITIIFTRKGCHYRYEHLDQGMASFRYDSIGKIKVDHASRTTSVVLSDGKTHVLPFANDHLRDYLKAIQDNVAYKAWQEKQVKEEFKYRHLLWSLFSSTMISGMVMIVFFNIQEQDLPGSTIMLISIVVFIPVQIIVYILMKTWALVKKIRR